MTRIITLDESGLFEEREKDICFIGGLLKDTDDIEQEKSGMEVLLKKACDDFNNEHRSELSRYNVEVCYPMSLHGGAGKIFFRKNDKGECIYINEVNDKPEINRVGKKFSQFLQKRLINYLKENGFKAYIFVDAGKGEYKQFGSMHTNVLNEDVGSNLYEEMATTAVINHVIYSVSDSVPDVFSFQLATRKLARNANDDNEEFDRLYKTRRGYNNKSVAEITNTNTYKTSLGTALKMLKDDTAYAGTTFYFNVNEIDYNGGIENQNSLMYATDILCSYIRYNYFKDYSGRWNMKENCWSTPNALKIPAEFIIKKTAENDSVCIDIRLHCESEFIYRKMNMAMKEANLLEYYSCLYNIEHSKDSYKEFYLKVQIPILEKMLEQKLFSKEDNGYKERIAARLTEFSYIIDGYMGSREKDYSRGLYLAEKMLKIIECRDDDGNDRYQIRNKYSRLGRNLFLLHDIVMRGYNHEGAVDKTMKEFVKCARYAKYVSTDEYTEHVIRALQYYYNSCDYESANLLCNELTERIKRICDTGHEVVQIANKIARNESGKNAVLKATEGKSGNILSDTQEQNNDVSDLSVRYTADILCGKIMSSKGQACGFLQKYDEGAAAFEEALQHFVGQHVNYNITLSYYLHLMIDNKRQDDYEKWAYQYFEDKNDLEGQYVSVRNQVKKYHSGFGLYVFVKAFRYFYANRPGNKKMIIKMIEESLSEPGDVVDEHPWELIFANLYWLCYDSEDEAIRQYCGELYNRAMGCIGEDKRELTIDLINLSFRLNKEFAEGKNLIAESVDDNISEQEFSECLIVFGDRINNIINLNELRELLNEKMTYMYH